MVASPPKTTQDSLVRAPMWPWTTDVGITNCMHKSLPDEQGGCYSCGMMQLGSYDARAPCLEIQFMFLIIVRLIEKWRTVFQILNAATLCA
jgi:hypothetical protein